jgi:hypothetical protein
MGEEMICKEGVEESEYVGNIMYTCMQMEKWTSSSYSKNEGRRDKGE